MASREHSVPEMDVFATRIRERARQLGLSLAQVARRADVPERSFAHCAAGRSEPDLATLVRISRALGVHADYLLGIEEDVVSQPENSIAHLRERIRVTCLLLDERALKLADGVLTSLAEHERGRRSSRKE